VLAINQIDEHETFEDEVDNGLQFVPHSSFSAFG